MLPLLGERQLLDRLSSLSEVQYNPGNVCSTGTRCGILRDIEVWASDFSPPYVASLRGKAGIGKSTVANTVSAGFSNIGCLAASYFFRRDVAMARPLKNLFPEIARQFAFRLSSFRRNLCQVLEKEDIPLFPRQQLSKLFIEPFRMAMNHEAKTHPWIIVLDALDECEDDIRDCLLLLTEAIAEFRGSLKFIITSRPEAAIDAVQQLRHTHVLSIDIASAENDSDLRIYFQLKLKSLVTRQGWPATDPTQRFVTLAGGLFVWAAVVTEFLLESDTLAEEIELVLNGTQWEDNPEKRLGQMYNIILEKAYLAGNRQEHFRLFLPVLGTIMVVRSPQSDVVIKHLAGNDVRQERLSLILGGLSAALHIPPDSPVVRAIHPSFFRYISGDCKDPRFAVEPVTQSRKLGRRCLSIILQTVHRDICGIMEFSDVPHKDISDLKERISKYIPDEMQYACKNWIFHTTIDPRASPDDELEGLLNTFFQSALLGWIEVMGLLDCLSIADGGLNTIQRWLKVTPFILLLDS
jgi:hypothetical protein